MEKINTYDSSHLPILYSFRRCPYAMRARLALYTAKISHEHREVDLWPESDIDKRGGAEHSIGEEEEE